RGFPRVSLLTALAALVALALVVVVIVLVSGGASQSAPTLPPIVRRVGPESIFTPGPPLKANPAATLDKLKRLGVDRVRIFLGWSSIAPDPLSRVRPAFHAADPAAYPAANWGIYDTIVRDTVARGMGLDVTLGPPPPLWASGGGAPHPTTQTQWKPSASAFGSFVRAVATRYSGHYRPLGASKPLPRVGFWSIWNEPNGGFQLAPQAIHHSTVEVAPALYRHLLDAAWSALHATGHRHDTILIGEVAPAGATVGDVPGNFAVMAPLRFVRALYCVDSSYRPLLGAAAAARQCPTTATGSARFAARNPALFHAAGFADHPYPQGLPPNEPTPGEPDFAELAEVPRLEQVLDTVQQVYGSHARLAIYSTEFGYQTTPPDTELGTTSPTLAAYYLNWSEYITWRDRRMRSFDQYLLVDSPRGIFASALEFANGKPKPGYFAYRMPIYLPVTATIHGHPLEVWACVRPAHYARVRTHKAQIARIEFRPATGGPFQTLARLKLTDRYGYFDVTQVFPSSGSVRIAWSYPHGPTVFSRTVTVTVR
ncbi:MAG: hypothetical protein JO169_15260, partial [Solirubrobacterales bacterium]|nr:hypothetical protein [Solirubrobacterales bacterium]